MGSAAMHDKADRYVAEGRVRRLGPDQAEVQGSQPAPYRLERVTVKGQRVWRCDCPAVSACAHILAVEAAKGGTDNMTRDVLLNQPLDPSHVRQRSAFGEGEGGKKLSYVEAHHVIREANRIFGFGKWKRELRELRLVTEGEAYTPKTRDGKPERRGWRAAYVAVVRVYVQEEDGKEWIANDGTGYGQNLVYRTAQDNPDSVDKGGAHEKAVKEAESDAMKRALILWGDPFGLALYDKEQRHVGTEDDWEEAPPEAVPQNLDLDVDELVAAAKRGGLAQMRTALKALGVDNETKLRSALVAMKYPDPADITEFLRTLRGPEKSELLEYLKETRHG